MDWLELGATALGGLLGASGGGDKTQTTSKDPWGPAQPYLLDNLARNKQLQDYYQQTPFNPQQIQNYSNLQGDIGNFRDNVMPGLMDFANKGMTSSYQRQTGGAVGSGGGYGGAVVPGGLRQSGTGPFSVAQGAGARSTGVNGLLDLNGAQNPYQNGAIPSQSTSTAAMTSGGLLGNQQNYGGGGNQNMGSNPASQESNPYGIGSSFNTDAAMSVASKASALGLAPAAIAGLVAGIREGYMSESDIAAAVASLDKALADKDARNHGGYGSVGTNADSDGSAGSTNPGGGGISGYGGGTY